jgi:cell pole-organizing protein PopZ
LRNIDEIRGSIKDLILKAENEELLNIQNKESPNLSNESENSENQLSDEILKQINLEVTEFQKAFKENGSEELISQTIRETIKPILYEWLKINLPVIVKEVIDEKINEIREKN